MSGFQPFDYNSLDRRDWVEEMEERLRPGFDRIAEANEERQEAARASILMSLIASGSTSGACYERINEQIKQFDESLDAEHEVGMKLVTFGQAITFRVLKLGYHDPSLIFFHGLTDDGEFIQLIQHVSQISFVLIAKQRLNLDEPKRPFGFAQGHAPAVEPKSD